LNFYDFKRFGWQLSKESKLIWRKKKLKFVASAILSGTIFSLSQATHFEKGSTDCLT